MNKLPNHPLNTAAVQPYPVVLTIIVHLILGVLLWWGAQWVQPKPLIEAELWDAASLDVALNDTKAIVTPQVTVPPVEIDETPPAVVKIEESNEPVDIETKTTPKATSMPTPVTKPEKPVVKEPTKPVVTNKPVTPVKKTTTKPVDNTARDAVLGSSKTAAKTSKSGSSGSSNADIGRLKSAIEGKGRDRGLSGLSGNITIKVSPSGSISVISVSGLPADKQTVLRQVVSSVNVRDLSPDTIGKNIPFRVVFR